MGHYISYVERYKKFEVNQTSATKEEYDKRPRSNIAAPAIGTFVGISRYFEVYGEAVKACEIANKYLMDDNKIYEIPDNCIKDTALFKMYKCEECGRYWMKNNMFNLQEEKLCPYCRQAPGYTDNPKEPKTKYLICFKNLGTGAVHKGGNIFEDEEEAGQFCIKLNAGSPNIIKALGEYIYVPIQEW